MGSLVTRIAAAVQNREADRERALGTRDPPKKNNRRILDARQKLQHSLTLLTKRTITNFRYWDLRQDETMKICESFISHEMI